MDSLKFTTLISILIYLLPMTVLSFPPPSDSPPNSSPPAAHEAGVLPFFYSRHHTTIITLISAATAIPIVQSLEESSNHDHDSRFLTRSSPPLQENTPWHVRNLEVYIDAPCATANQNITFCITDTNPGLEFDTVCERALPVGSQGSLVDETHWFLCEDNDVKFQFLGEKIGIQRVYRDASISTNPQYQGVNVLGFATLTLVNQTTPTGVSMTQEELDVPIQYQSS